MDILKCKMCGGALKFDENQSVAMCEYCSSKQTLPKLSDEKIINLYARANNFRANNEFDKAMGIYEQILNEQNNDSEAYWSMVLCRYGIEYVEDHISHRRLPTVNRAQFTSIFDDVDYKSALQYADAQQKEVYESEARAINEIQRGILAISQKEDPFDVFICYKETDNNGRRTYDSVIANDLYHQLTQVGFRVFFSRITLEDKLGSAYEPYIFAALNSAKVMVVLGTRPEYFNAVWVKNEWNRYLSLVKKSKGEKILIPAYKDMNPYDLPEEFSHLQAQDMSRLGFMQDLIRGIKKIVHIDEPLTKDTVVKKEGFISNLSALLERGFLSLEDHEWDEADEFFEQVLNQDARNPQAYLGKLMVELRVSGQSALINQKIPFDKSSNYQKVLRFADDELRKTLMSYTDFINQRNENERLEKIYIDAVNAFAFAKTSKDFLEASKMFGKILHYKDSAQRFDVCKEKAENIYKDETYMSARALMSADNKVSYMNAIGNLTLISGWRDSNELILYCKQRILQIESDEEHKRMESIRLAETKKTAHEAEEIRIKNHRDMIDEKNRKIKKCYLINVIALLVLPAIPLFFDPELMDFSSLGEILSSAIVILIMDVILQTILSLPTLIPTTLYMLLKRNPKKSSRGILRLNIFSKIMLSIEICVFSFFFFVLTAIDPVGSMFGLFALLNIGILIITFLKKDYKY